MSEFLTSIKSNIHELLSNELAIILLFICIVVLISILILSIVTKMWRINVNNEIIFNIN